MPTIQRVVLAARPEGAPRATDFRFETAELPPPGPGEVLVRTIYVSLDPFVRGRLGPGLAYGSSRPPLALGEPILGGGIAEVVTSADPGFAPGDLVLASPGWQTHALQDAATLRRLDPAVAPLSTALGVLGMPGFTGYAGLVAIGRPQPGETVVVAAASGPVGSLVGQLARRRGARVVGIAGGERKVSWLREIGFDVALDHRDPDFARALESATPDGIDVYFENVGGHVLEAVFPRLNQHARVPVCGLVSDYNGTTRIDGPNLLPAFLSAVLSRFITVQGFPYTAYWESHHEEFFAEVSAGVADGSIRYREDVVNGLENAAEAFIGLLAGQNFGKLLVRVAPEPAR